MSCRHTDRGLDFIEKVHGQSYRERMERVLESDEDRHTLQQSFEVITAGQVYGSVWARSSENDDESLSLVNRLRVTLGILAAIGAREELEHYIRAAIRSGVSEREVVEIFIHAASYAGLAAGKTGMRALLAVLNRID